MVDNCKCSDHVVNGSDTISHCGDCHITFFGIGAFDKHLRRQPNGKAYHVNPATDANSLWWIDNHNRWHHGEKGKNPWAKKENSN